MTRRRIRPTALAAIVMALGCLGGMAAQAQTPLTASATPGTLTVRPGEPAGAPIFHLFGLPVRVTAPVEPAYVGSAYRTFAGQAARSGEALLAQGIEER
ncbi:conserved exported protein of unknown function [Rhodovastum atsumiense]|uniref:Uncharacterized protein n=1 Tax=Rhodovastum atsumiense TaxID=504468 RepID=A0A5M6ITI3_9PROT|nr:hypothetical protein [Rhodovastum atsumiense]KAA5610858.1 hypothetical protein F1189_17440 [Rhodovastum atsumiense]CAH2602086.1 conserved exported protein of unknown function [Rhodovastum atsumiense]